jgi:rhamnosyl/mannosyltransferase
VTGRIVPARDSALLADALCWMAEHPEEARAMGLAGRERALTRFGIGAMVDAYDETYRRALARRRH